MDDIFLHIFDHVKTLQLKVPSTILLMECILCTATVHLFSSIFISNKLYIEFPSPQFFLQTITLFTLASEEEWSFFLSIYLELIKKNVGFFNYNYITQIVQKLVCNDCHQSLWTSLSCIFIVVESNISYTVQFLNTTIYKITFHMHSQTCYYQWQACMASSA